jgi:hypothetical protein
MSLIKRTRPPRDQQHLPGGALHNLGTSALYWRSYPGSLTTINMPVTKFLCYVVNKINLLCVIFFTIDISISVLETLNFEAYPDKIFVKEWRLFQVTVSSASSYAMNTYFQE